MKRFLRVFLQVSAETLTRGGRKIRHLLIACVLRIFSASSYLNSTTPVRVSTKNVAGHFPATTARPECSCSTGVRLESLRPCHADPDPAALAAGQLQNKVQAVLPRPRHPLRSQPGVSDGNGPVSRRQQITLRAPLIFHLISLYHGCARSSASGRSHMRVLPYGTLCPTSAPCLILSSSEICSNHTF